MITEGNSTIVNSGHQPDKYQFEDLSEELTKALPDVEEKKGKFNFGIITTLTTRPKWIIVYLGEMPQKR